jgi:hypothetical protein
MDPIVGAQAFPDGTLTSSQDTKVTASVSDVRNEDENNLVFSYLTMRNLIGFSGSLLPIVLLLATQRLPGDKKVEPSISDYYYTNTGDILVVMLSVLGVFLFTYKGYNRKEKVWTTLAAVCGIGVAFSPTKTRAVSTTLHMPNPDVPMIFGIERHLLIAATFLVALAIISLRFFPKTDQVSLRKDNGKLTQKGKRNRVYITCGVIMLASVATLVAYFLVPAFKTIVGEFPLIFTMEAVAVEAFAFSWLTKGETFWPDGEHYVATGWKEMRSWLFGSRG